MSGYDGPSRRDCLALFVAGSAGVAGCSGLLDGQARIGGPGEGYGSGGYGVGGYGDP